MAFACQRNSYLKELVSKVVSCTQIKNGYEVVLNDTVFFPEGGGQVCLVPIHILLSRFSSYLSIIKMRVLCIK